MIYRAADGELVSSTATRPDAASLAARSLEFLDVVNKPDRSLMWDAATRALVPRPPDPQHPDRAAAEAILANPAPPGASDTEVLCRAIARRLGMG